MVQLLHVLRGPHPCGQRQLRGEPLHALQLHADRIEPSPVARVGQNGLAGSQLPAFTLNLLPRENADSYRGLFWLAEYYPAGAAVDPDHGHPTHFLCCLLPQKELQETAGGLRKL